MKIKLNPYLVMFYALAKINIRPDGREKMKLFTMSTSISIGKISELLGHTGDDGPEK